MKFKSLIKLSLASLIVLASCSKSDDETPTPKDPQPVDNGKYIITDNQSKLVSNLNGFRFDGGFGTKEPVSYPFLWLQHIEDYNDSIRVVILNQNSFKTITKYMAANIHNGKTTRYFDHSTFPNNVSNSMSFKFNNKDFILNTIDKINGAFTERGVVFGFETQQSRSLNYLRNYPYKLINKYIIRYISGISFWPQQASSGTDEPQFVATGELSDPISVDHYIDENFPTFPHDIKSNMYSGFFQSDLEKTYIGFSKGGENLATLTLFKNNPDGYVRQTANSYIDKVGDVLYLGLLINEPPKSELKRSLYKCDLKTNTITALYTNVVSTHSIQAFSKGCFYVADGTKHFKINTSGNIEPITIPDAPLGIQIGYSKNKIFAIATDVNTRRVEIYSKPLN